MKVWITRSCISTGKIRVADLEVKPVHGGGTLYAHEKYSLHKMGKDAFDTEEEAIFNAECRRAAKIKSIEKQIEKIKSLKWECTP